MRDAPSEQSKLPVSKGTAIQEAGIGGGDKPQGPEHRLAVAVHWNTQMRNPAGRARGGGSQIEWLYLSRLAHRPTDTPQQETVRRVATATCSGCAVFISRAYPTVRLPADLLSGAWDVTNNRKAVDTQGTRATKPTGVGAKVVAATRNQLTPLRLSDWVHRHRTRCFRAWQDWGWCSKILWLGDWPTVCE